MIFSVLYDYVICDSCDSHMWYHTNPIPKFQIRK